MIDKRILEDIRKLDNNSKLIIKCGLYGSLAMIKNAEKNILEIINELDK